ncbi:MAG: InlB B-repeat-containing protein, partial [Lachnospiraceae bacterium]|nr:InlB B-repeat-containing protein [Lachnospiraceae bacterium]
MLVIALSMGSTDVSVLAGEVAGSDLGGGSYGTQAENGETESAGEEESGAESNTSGESGESGAAQESGESNASGESSTAQESEESGAAQATGEADTTEATEATDATETLAESETAETEETEETEESTMALLLGNAQQAATITYEANGGSGEMDVTSGTVGEDVTISACSFTYTDHIFSCWNTAADGSGTSYSAGASLEMPQGGLTLYARWEDTEESSDYRLLVNGVSLPVGTSDGWYRLSYDADATFSVTVGSESYTSGINVYYASSMDALSSSTTKWTSTPAVGEYYLAFNIPLEAIVPDPSTYNYKIAVVDTVAPTVESFTVSGDHLLVEAYDEGAGLVSYAISTATSKEAVAESDWVSVGNAPVTGTDGISLEEDYSDLAAGTYYLYVQDASGNIARSGAVVYISALSIEEYYQDNVLTTYRESFATVASDPAASLPETSRTKFTFDGYYDNASYNGDVLSGSIVIAKGTEQTVYAKWSLQGVSFTTDLDASYTRTYDGEDLTLSVALSDTYDELSFSWEYSETEDGEFTTLSGGENGSYALRSVSESGYYRAVAQITEDGVSAQARSSTAHVTINKRPLSLSIDDQTISYRSEAPVYTVSAAAADATSGLVGEDTLSTALGEHYAANLVCDYRNDGSANSAAGTYEITAGEGFASTDYELTVTSGTLTVTPIELSDASDVTVTLEADSFTYTGSAIEPAVTAVSVTCQEETVTLSEEDYTVSYASNAAVTDAAQVILTFRGNYTGSYSGKTFAITKATYTVQTSMSLSTWKYGDTSVSATPSVDDYRGGTITYHYLEKGDEESFEAADTSGALTTMPTDAGTYYVWATIGETANYNAITALPAEFTIAQREITLTSASQTWTYDGNAHTAGTYVQSGDGFAEGEGFLSVTVSGSVKNVAEPVTNAITYTLSSATNAENYAITLAEGTLRVTQAPLPQITSLAWGSSAGTLTWVAITRDGLNINYEIQLYKDGEMLGEPLTTSATSLSVKEIIRADSIANGVGGYSATITAKIAEDDAGMYLNYTEGTASALLAEKYTARVALSQNGGDEGIASYAFTGASHREDEDDTVTYLLQGESAVATVTYADGYEADTELPAIQYTAGSTGLSSDAFVVTDEESGAGYYRIRFASGTLSAAVQSTVVVKSLDSAPVCELFTGTQAEDYSYVRARFIITDELGLYGYQIVPSVDEITDDGWTEITPLNEVKEFQTSVDLTAAGDYYLVYKDNGGNIRYCETPVTVYAVSFDKNADDAQGEMETIYKLKGATVVLPANTFTYAGYVFTNWTGNGAILPDEASYVKDANVTLYAGWTNKRYSYSVHYYYQTFSLNEDGTVVTDEDGNVVLSYSDTPDSTETYSCAYNYELSYDNEAIRKDREGYTLTGTPEISGTYVSQITVTQDEMSLNIYYQLNRYRMSYTYTDYDGSSASITKYFYYGEPFVEVAKPSHVGYSFIGWNYGDGGVAPTTMPAGNVSATGSFKANTASYIIRYYFQNLDANNADGNYLAYSFALDSSLQAEEVISADYGTAIHAYVSSTDAATDESTSAKIVTAREITGFTPAAVVVSYESSDAMTGISDATAFETFVNDTSADADTTHAVYSAITGDIPDGVQNGPTYVSFYYTRNTYTLSMDVYQGNRDLGIHLFGSYYDGTDGKEDDQAIWTFPYGYIFPEEGNDLSAAYFETYGYLSKGTQTYDNGKVHSVAWTARWQGEVTADKYYLADFVDWSTGTRPVTMPAGNVKVVREYASREQSKYRIEVYLETVKETDHGTYKSDDAGYYELETTVERYIEPGKTVTIADSGEASDTTILVSKLMESIECKEYYQHDRVVEDEVLSGVILENQYDKDNNLEEDSMTVLKLYMSRKSYPVTVNYYRRDYDESDGSYTQTKLTGYTLSQKWGTSYFIDSEYYYSGEVTSSVPTGSNTDDPNAHTYLGNVQSADAVENLADFDTLGYGIANYWYYYSPTATTALNMGGYVGGHGDYTQYDADYTVDNDRYKKIKVGTGAESSSTQTHADIYYLQPVDTRHYFLKLTYRKYDSETGLLIGDTLMTYDDNGTTYQVCVANRSDIFETTDGVESLRSEFEAVPVTYSGVDLDGASVEGTFYRIKNDTRTTPLLFAAIDSNPFYIGNLASFNYNRDVTAHIGRELFDAEDNTPAASYGTATKVAHGVERISTEGCEYPIAGVGEGTEDLFETQLCYYFDFVKDFAITYSYDGKTNRIDYGQIVTVDAEDIGYDKDGKAGGIAVFDPGEGYEIVWYKDALHTEVADDDIELTGPVTLYGVRFNKPIENLDVAYYQLPNSTSYYTGSLDDLYAVEEPITISYAYNSATVVEKSGTYTKYYKSQSEPILYASTRSHYVTAYNEFSLPYTDYVLSGYAYDEKNTNNVLSGFCGSSAIKLRAYYERTSATLTVRKNDSANANDEVTTQVNGSAIQVTNPQKQGYTLTGWKLYDNTDTENPTELSTDDYDLTFVAPTESSVGSVTFSMPICPTLLIAQWSPAEIDFEIVHLYQDNSMTYQQDLLDAVRAGEETGESVVTQTNGSVTYYYIDTADANHLFAAVETLSGVKSEDVITVNDHNLAAAIGDMFTFSTGTYQHDADDSKALSLTAEGQSSFAAYVDAEVTYYYERENSIVIVTQAYCSDGAAETGLTLSGAGSYYYGQEVTLYATMQPTGYTFRGWYLVASADGLTAAQIQDLESLITAADAGESDVLTKVSDATQVSLDVTASGNYIAVTTASVALTPEIEIEISRDLETDPLYYNYASDTRNQFNATVNWGEGVDSGANNIKAYTWYYYDASDLTQAQFEALDIDAIDTSEMTEIANSNTNTFNLPTGYAAGYYVLRCVAQIERKDNGRTSLAEGSYRFAILPNEAYLETTALEDQSYTGSSYTYTENWIYTPQDYTIYYSESPFTVGEDVTDRLNLEDGNAQKAVLTKPEYRDVVVDDVHNPIAHTVYYYVESRDPNYASLTGSSSVEILPVTVTVTAKKAFTKIYDGRVEVQGKPDDTQAGSVTYKYSEADGTYSDYYRLQSGIEAEGETADPYYTINGILAVDSDKTMMLNFDAEFDYPHASGSGTQEGTLVTLTNLWVLSSDAESGLHEVYENWNYVFPSGQTLLLSGQIKPYPLEIKWVPTEADYQSEDVESATYAASQFYYTYTGSEQAPLIKIVGDTSRIPDSTDEFSVSVKNKQTNAGTYQAIPEVEAAENATYFPTDYTFTLENQTYKILPRSLRVSPADVTRTYNATAQTMLDTAGEFVFESRESESDSYSAYTLPGGEYYSATASAAYTDAGVYEGITTQTLSIYTLNNGVRNVITDNYVVEYGTGTLTIEPCPVQIDGITGVDKEYDGTVDAALDLSQARITLASDGTSSIYAGDALTLECVGTPGDFASASVGNDKTVTIYYVTDDQTTRGVALKAEGAYQNYKIDTERSQSTTTANILKNGKINIYLTSDDTEITYGETLPASFFDYTFDELASGDSIDTDVIRADGYPKFRIMKQDESGAYVNAVAEDHSFSQSDDLSFIGTLDVGTYDIFFVEKTDEESTGHHFVEGFSSEKYNICWDYEHPVTITVNKRKIMVSGIDTAAEITREYNGEITVPDEAKALLVGEGGSHDYYAWSSVPNISASGVLVADADKLVISGIEAVYNSKDVATETDGVVSGATKISVSEAVLSGEAAGNYQLINSTFDVPAAITPKEVTVTVNNQTTTYGSAQAAYEFTLDGEIAADTETILAGFADAAQTTIDCDYSAVETPAEGKSHNAGYYAMNINAQTHYTNANYSFTFPTAQGNQGDSYGLLTVEKKTLHYTASDETISYGVENPPTIYDGAFTEADFAYGESIATQKNAGEKAKILGQGVDGSVPVYRDSALTSTATDYVVEFTCMDGDQAVSASSVAGDYAITPANVESLYTQNYTLVAVNGTLTITKFYLLVKGVEIAPKTYDGTKVVDPGQIGLDAVTVTYYDGAQKKENISYEDLPEEYQDSLAVSAQYLDKNVSESVDVDLSITIVEGSYLDERYQILTAENAQEAAQYDKDSIFTGQVTQTGTTGEITAKRLTLTPGDLTIAYATSVTDDMIAVTGDGFVTGESISDIPDYALGYEFRPAYTAGSDVGPYTIDISSTQPGSGVRGNYEIWFAYGTMTVTQAAFPAPTNLSWSGGVLSWDAVAKIGNVTVAGYELTLAKEGMQDPITTIACHERTSYDFTSLIRESGEGTYTVSIRTVADTKNNTDYQNVAQYSDSTASAAKK